jgi:hypothetical protein
MSTNVMPFMCFVRKWLRKSLLTLCTQIFLRAPWVLTVCSTPRARLGLHTENAQWEVKCRG